MTTPEPPPPIAPPVLPGRSKAWSCLMVNLMVCPGAGSLMGRRRSGFFELALAMTGALIVLLSISAYFLAWMRNQMQGVDSKPYFHRAAIGVALFVVSWLWSLFTGLSLVRNAPRS